jgi:predicted DNA-binding transcriptional regulator AlpA
MRTLRVIDIAELLGVSKQRAYQIADDPGFPAPVAEDGRGRLWDRRKVQGWQRRWASRETLPLADCWVVGDVVDDVDVFARRQRTDAQTAVPVQVEGGKHALWVWEVGGRREHLDDLREGEWPVERGRTVACRRDRSCRDYRCSDRKARND